MQAEPFEVIEDGGVTTPKGFTASAASAGVKTPGSDKLDLMLLYTPHPTVAAATFTSNRVQAAPVKVTRDHWLSDELRAVFVNSGNANACNGERGMADALEMAQLAADALGLRRSQVAVGSTGVIGTPLPMERIRPWITSLAESLNEDPVPPSLAIMTSDTIPKRCSVKLTLGDKEVKIGAMAKGAGMICPNMATMLCYITTDALINRETLQKLTRAAVEKSFNRISVDGDMSTNDTVLVIANGQADNPIIGAGSPEADQFYQALHHVMLTLAKMIVNDAEKSTRYIELTVAGARTEEEAHQVAKAVANSILVKCSWNSGGPYWGRIMHAIGYSGVEIEEEKIDIYYGDLLAAKNGTSAGRSVKELREVTDNPEFSVRIDLHQGEAKETVYASDISREFVDFNLVD